LSQNTRTENYYEGQTHGQEQESLDLTLHICTTHNYYGKGQEIDLQYQDK